MRLFLLNYLHCTYITCVNFDKVVAYISVNTNNLIFQIITCSQSIFYSLNLSKITGVFNVY